MEPLRLLMTLAEQLILIVSLLLEGRNILGSAIRNYLGIVSRSLRCVLGR